MEFTALIIRVRKIPSNSLGPKTEYLPEAFRSFPRYLQIRDEKEKLHHEHFLPHTFNLLFAKHYTRRSHWPRGLRRESAAIHLLGLRVRIPLRAWMCVSCECCVLLGIGFCVGMITRPEESYCVWCV
jgi:hypothetical protein